MRITLRTRVRLGPAAGEVTGPQADRVRAHLGRVGDARVADLMHRCHLTAPEIGDLLRLGALHVAGGLRRCETCRAPVTTGTLCPSCRARLAAPLVGLVTHQPEPEEEPLTEQEAAVKRALAAARAMRRAQVQRSAEEDEHPGEPPVLPPATATEADGRQASRALARSRMWSRLRRHA